MTTPRIDVSTRATTPDDAVSRLKSGMRVFVHGAAATTTPLLEALVRHRALEDVQLFHPVSYTHLTLPTNREV